MNRRGFIYWIILIIVLLVLSGLIYFKFTSSGVEIGSKTTNNSINLDYNGSIQKVADNAPNISINTPSDNLSIKNSSDNISIVGR